MNAVEHGHQPAISYNATARILHWLIAAMVVLQLLLANLAEQAEDSGSKFQQLVLLANHKSVGLTILVLVIIRLAWRFYRPPPAPLPMPAWQNRAASISHYSFYSLLFLMPLSGWLMSSASAISVSWFNLFPLPDLIGPNEGLEELFEEIHEVLAKVLMALALVHILAALKHTVIERDGALRRISSKASLAVFVVALIVGVLALTKIGRANEVDAENNLSADDVSTAEINSDENLPPLWQIDYANSFIRFTAEQAGAEFKADWKVWQAALRFDAKQMSASDFDVSVTANSVATMDKERDETLMDSEWFDGDHFPEIFYRASDFSVLPKGGYLASGEMEVKGKTTPVNLTFSIKQDDERIVLRGNASLDRLALGVGTGEWLDTTWVGQFVEVEVRVEATLQ